MPGMAPMGMPGMAPMGGQGPTPGSQSGFHFSARPGVDVPMLDLTPDVKALVEHYGIQDHQASRLMNALNKREATMKEDVNALWDILAEARNPGGLLSVKLKELEDGTFTGRRRGGGGGGGGGGGSNVNLPPEVKELCDHFDIEDRLRGRLGKCLEDRGPDTREDDMAVLWDALGMARAPAGLLVSKMKSMEDGTFESKGKAAGKGKGG